MYKTKNPLASFEEKYVQTRIFSNTHFNMRRNHFLVHWTRNTLPHILMFLVFSQNTLKRPVFNILLDSD